MRFVRVNGTQTKAPIWERASHEARLNVVAAGEGIEGWRGPLKTFLRNCGVTGLALRNLNCVFQVNGGSNPFASTMQKHDQNCGLKPSLLAVAFKLGTSNLT